MKPQVSLSYPEMCSERDSPLKRLYRRTHAKLTRLAGSGQLVWAAGCELSLALVHARRPAWPGETSETILRVAPPRKTRPPDHSRVNWPVDASASGSAQVGPGGRHRWAARVQVGQEPARQKAREGYPSHYTSLSYRDTFSRMHSWCALWAFVVRGGSRYATAWSEYYSNPGLFLSIFTIIFCTWDTVIG